MKSCTIFNWNIIFQCWKIQLPHDNYVLVGKIVNWTLYKKKNINRPLINIKLIGYTSHDFTSCTPGFLLEKKKKEKRQENTCRRDLEKKCVHETLNPIYREMKVRIPVWNFSRRCALSRPFELSRHRFLLVRKLNERLNWFFLWHMINTWKRRTYWETWKNDKLHIAGFTNFVNVIISVRNI